jgi:hypothetical protein
MKWLNISSLSGLRPSRIPETLHPERDWTTLPNSLESATGCDIKRGLFNTTSMAALVGVGRQHLENVLPDDPNASFVYRNGSFFATMPSSLSAYWENRQDNVKAGQQARAIANQSEATRAALDKLLKDIN